MPIDERGRFWRDSLVNAQTRAVVNVKFIDRKSADFLTFAVNVMAF